LGPVTGLYGEIFASDKRLQTRSYYPIPTQLHKLKRHTRPPSPWSTPRKQRRLLEPSAPEGSSNDRQGPQAPRSRPRRQRFRGAGMASLTHGSTGIKQQTGRPMCGHVFCWHGLALQLDVESSKTVSEAISICTSQTLTHLDS